MPLTAGHLESGACSRAVQMAGGGARSKVRIGRRQVMVVVVVHRLRLSQVAG